MDGLLPARQSVAGEERTNTTSNLAICPLYKKARQRIDAALMPTCSKLLDGRIQGSL